MDGQPQSIPQQLYQNVETASAPILVGCWASRPNDHEMLKHGMIMYDALYAWSRQQVARQSQLKVMA
jgi:hypothetical protein